jgi:putative transposase
MRFYHVWFSTKRRQPLLEGDVRNAVLSWFSTIATEIDVHIEAAEARLDHAHLLIGVQDWHSLAVVMQRIKGRSSREVLLQFPELRNEGDDSPFWQKGYGSHIVARDQIPAIRRYIESQEEHHALSNTLRSSSCGFQPAVAITDDPLIAG